MNSKFKINDIVQLIDDDLNKNLFGKINGMKFETVDGVIKCIGIQVIIDIKNNEILRIDPNNLAKLVDQELAETVFMLQNLTGDNLRNALSFLSFDSLFNIYCLKNIYINDAFNAREAIKIDFRYSTSDIFLDLLEIFPKYKQLYSTQNKISNIFDILINTEYITFNYNFNRSLDDSLHNLKNLKYLTFGFNFKNGNEPLGNSLSTLVNLESLIFDYNFTNGNESLGDSLHNLINLKTLTFGYSFRNGDKPLGNSLSKLVNLESLIFDDCFTNGTQPIGDSLKNLINLKTLCFGDHFTNGNLSEDITMTHTLGDSLSTLVNLEKLCFGYYFGLYNKQLGNSLHNLKNLRILGLGYNFNSNYKLIRNSFEGLTNLVKLELGYHYDREIYLGDIFGGILKGLINLKQINRRPYIQRNT